MYRNPIRPVINTYATLSKHSSLLDTGTIDDCWVHLINDGITVNEDSVTIEWQGTGPGAIASPPLEYQCKLQDITSFQQCMFVRDV